MDFNNLESLINSLSKLVKETINNFETKSEFESIDFFSKKFVDFFPKEITSLNNIDYDKIFVGKNSEKIIDIYKSLLEIWKESQITGLEGMREKIDYSDIKKRLKITELKLDSLS